MEGYRSWWAGVLVGRYTENNRGNGVIDLIVAMYI